MVYDGECFFLFFFFLRTVILVSLRIFSPMIWNLSKDRQLLPRGCFTGYHLPLLRRRKGERQSLLFTIHDPRHGLIWFKEYCSTPSERCFSRGSFELLSLRLSEVRVVTRLCSVVVRIWSFERVVWFFSTNQSTVLNKKNIAIQDWLWGERML